MILFPIYISFVAQWTEIRADFLGAKLLEGGMTQMAEGLRELGLAQDKARDKRLQYGGADEKPMKRTSSIDRDNCFFRFIEFNFKHIRHCTGESNPSLLR